MEATAEAEAMAVEVTAGGHAMGHGGFGGHRVAINHGSIGHDRLAGRRFGRGFYAYGGNYCDPYNYPNGCYGISW